MLIGQYTSKLTDKERVAVPKKFREELGEELIIAKWYENCLVLVPPNTWQKLLKRLVGKTELVTAPVRDIDRFILGSAFEIKLDFQGRFVLPEILKNFSEIENEVTFIGLGDRVEIWSSDKWIKLEGDLEKKASESIETISKSQQ
jgi:MraZ protein